MRSSQGQSIFRKAQRVLSRLGLASLASALAGGATFVAADALQVHPENPRYFTDGTGRAVYLAGSHTWNNLQDWGPPSPNFDYDAYLDLLLANNHNFFRLWAWEAPRVDTGAASDILPMPWLRPGPGTAHDGKPKFDLDQFDQGYFDRLRARVIAARDRGIYVSIMLFQQYVDWDSHPFNHSNNINGLDGSLNKLHTLDKPAVTAVQEAYVRKVIDTVNDLDNVLYEIGNELVRSSILWQHHMIDLIHDYEASKPRQHPVGMTSTGSVGTGDPLITNAELLASPAEWIAPHVEPGQNYSEDPPAATGAKVIVSDTDHLADVLCTANASLIRNWAWKTFARGGNLLWMEATQQVIPGVVDECQDTGHPGFPVARAVMGHVRAYADEMNLADMIPRGDLASTGYALANLGFEYLVYQPGSGAFTVDLEAGLYSFEWFNPATGQVVESGTVAVPGGSRNFTPPFNGKAVLYLALDSATVPPVAEFTGAPTSGEAPLSVDFTNQTGGGPVDSLLWDFGDGGSSTQANPSHVYNSADTFTVSLTAFGEGGTNTETKTGYVTVASPPPPPVAHFGASPTTGEVPLLVGFTNLTSGGTASSFLWNFGDGNTSATANPTHAYTSAGTFTVALTAFGPGGTNAHTEFERFVDVTGHSDGASVVVTNSRGRSVAGVFGGTNWTAAEMMLKLGTNKLFAIATDGSTNSASDMITVVRVHTNFVNTTLQVAKATLVLGDGPNADSVMVRGYFNDADLVFDPASDSVELLFGDYEATLPPGSLVNSKYKAGGGDPNGLDALVLKERKRMFTFRASGFTLTNGEPFWVALALGTDHGPDAISFPAAVDSVGKYKWSLGSQLPQMDQFFLGKSQLTTSSFELHGTLVVSSKPNVPTDVVCFGIGARDDALAAGGWTQTGPNRYEYTRPAGHSGFVESMTIDFDAGEWSAEAGEVDLSFPLWTPQPTSASKSATSPPATARSSFPGARSSSTDS